MSDVKAQPDSLEDISAGILNGAMLTLLGCALPGIIIWQIVARLTGWLPDLQAMAIDLPTADFKTIAADDRRAVIQDSLIGVMLLIGSAGFVQRGVKHIRKNLALLRARRR